MTGILNADQETVEKFLLRPLTSQEATYVEGLLNTAWFRLLLALPSLPARLAAKELEQTIVDDVVAEMVANVLKNPSGARSRTTTTNESMSLDDYSEQTQTSTQETIDRALAEGMLYPTESQLALLRPARAGAFTIRPGA